MLSVTVEVIDYEHDEAGLGVWHLRIPRCPQPILANDWGSEDGRLLVGATLTGVLYVQSGNAVTSVAEETALTVTRAGGNLNPSGVRVRGKLLDFYKASDTPLCHVIQSLVPIYAMAHEGLAGQECSIGEWVEVVGSACFMPDDGD